MPIQIATRGPVHGQCNICGEVGKLTEDHTPPKGCIKVGQVVIQHIVQRLAVEAPHKKGRSSQNGVKYRTICHRCNNSLLGAKYDIAFNQFVNTAGEYLKSTLALPPVVSVKGKPQKIMRAVLGHISAQGVDRYLKGPETESVRDYFLDDSQCLPASINVYYWVFPYNRQVLVRDCAYLDLLVGKPVAIRFMKFFPMAFMVTWQEPEDYKFDLPNMGAWRSIAIDDEVEMPIPLKKVVHPYWPDAPSETSVVTYGQEAIVALSRTSAER